MIMAALATGIASGFIALKFGVFAGWVSGALLTLIAMFILEKGNSMNEYEKTGLSFFEACKAAESGGNAIQRSDKKTFDGSLDKIVLIPGVSVDHGNLRYPIRNHVPGNLIIEGYAVRLEPVRGSQGDYNWRPWTASMDDMTANDWCVLPLEPPSADKVS